jgi:TolB protein
VFTSHATNLVPGDTNAETDIFVHNLKTQVTRRVSLASGGVQSTGGTKGWAALRPSISANGRVVAFSSNANNLVTPRPTHQYHWYVTNLVTGKTELVDRIRDGSPSAQGAGWGIVSPDGRFVVFASPDANIGRGDTNAAVDVFVRDLKTGTTRRVSVTTRGVQGNGASTGALATTPGAAVVAFQSEATNLVSNDTNGVADVFTHR